MNEIYSEVLENLRRQHSMNTQDIYGRRDGYLYNSGKYKYNDVQEDTNKNAFWTFSIKGKGFIFLTCVMLFSFYLYGEQDVKKGATMAWNDFYNQMVEIEEKPAYAKAMNGAKSFYKEIQDFLDTYFNID